jgi:hypothetical protein
MGVRRAELLGLAVVAMADRLLDEEGSDASEEDERAHHDPKRGPALLPFAFLEGVAAVARLAIGAVMRLGVDEVAETREDLLGIEPDEAHVGGDEPADERLGRELGVLVPLEGVQRLDADLGGRGDLLDRDAAFFALLPEKVA